MVKEYQVDALNWETWKKRMIEEVTGDIDINQKLEIINVYTTYRILDELPGDSNIEAFISSENKIKSSIYIGCAIFSLIFSSVIFLTLWKFIKWVFL